MVNVQKKKQKSRHAHCWISFICCLLCLIFDVKELKRVAVFCEISIFILVSPKKEGYTQQKFNGEFLHRLWKVSFPQKRLRIKTLKCISFKLQVPS